MNHSTINNIARIFCVTECNIMFTVQENDDCAILLSKEMGFPVFGILGTNFKAEHGKS